MDLKQSLLQRYSPATVRQYRSIITEFLEYNQVTLEDPRLLQVGKSEVESYLDSLPSSHSDSYRNQRVAAIAALYEILESPLPGLSSLRARPAVSGPKHGSSPVLSEDEARRIIQDLPLPYRLILSLLFDSGLSLAEVFALTPSDVQDGRVGRGPLNQWQIDRLKIWREDTCIDPGQTLFTPTHRYNLYKSLKRCVDRLGLSKRITPSSFRLGCARRLWKAGLSDTDVACALGVQSVQRYKKMIGG